MIDRMYRFLNQEKKERICNGISNEACKHTPRNYFSIILVNTLTKLGDVLSAPKTVITWLMGYIAAPIFLISLLVPIRESGSMLPQVFISHLLQKEIIRKLWWVVGSFTQAISLFSIIAVTLLIQDGTSAGIFIVLLTGLFSLGRALCSLTSKDVIGKTIPKTRRGKLNGYSSSLSGILVLISGFLLLVFPMENTELSVILWFIAAAGFLWVIAAGVFSTLIEFKSSEKIDALKEYPGFYALLKHDKVLQKFILARGLLISSALISPFIVLLAQQYIGTDIYLLGLFILAGGVASIISGPVWGHMADKSSKRVMIIGAGIVAALAIAVLVIIMTKISIISAIWLYPILFFALGVAHDGIRLGRKTYIVDIAEGEKRTQYVATSNTAIGLLLLIVGLFTAWLSSFSLTVSISVLTIMVLLGILFSNKLPEEK